MNEHKHEHSHSCGNDCANCECEHQDQDSMDWSDMISYACRHLGKFAVYGNYTAPPQEDDAALQALCEQFFKWCEKHGISIEDQERMLANLLTGKAVLFKTSEEAGKIFRFFLEKGVFTNHWFACLISPTEGIVAENA